VAGVDLDPSASARVISYDEAVKTWLKKPLFGHGVTGTYFIDGQYWRLLAETGIIGLAAFLMIFLRLLNGTVQADATCPAEDGFLKGTALGFFAGIVAMMTHALFTNSFIIVRIAEPFWMLAGLVLLIPYCARLEAEGLPEAD